MAIDLYYAPVSPACRCVRLVAEAIDLELNLILIDIFQGETHKPEFSELNPLKTVPFMVDGDLKIGESRAIICYLVDQYAKDDKFYPKSPNERATIDQRLQFDLTNIYKLFVSYYMPVLFGKTDTYDDDIYNKLCHSIDVLDKFLEGSDYVAGRTMTVADFSIIADTTTAEVLGFDFSPYKNVIRWMEKMKTSAPGYKQINEQGLDDWRKIIEMKKDQETNEEEEPENNEEEQPEDKGEEQPEENEQEQSEENEQEQPDEKNEEEKEPEENEEEKEPDENEKEAEPEESEAEKEPEE